MCNILLYVFKEVEMWFGMSVHFKGDNFTIGHKILARKTFSNFISIGNMVDFGMENHW